METKDWILLFTPIIFNGIILAYFEKVLERKFRLISQSDERKKRVVDDFMLKQNNARTKFVNMQKVIESPHSNNEFENVIHEFCNALQEMYDFCEANPKIMNKYRPFIRNLFDNYSELTNIFLYSENRNNYENQKLYKNTILRINQNLDEIDNLSYS